MSLRRSWTLSLGLCLTALVAGGASAGQVLTITTDVKGGWGQIVALQVNFEGQSSQIYAGALTTTTPGGPTVDTFCVDLYDETIPGTSWTVTLAPIADFAGNPSGDPSGGHGAALGALYSRYVGDDDDRIKAAALQIALWKVEYDGSTSLSTGNFQIADSADQGSDQHQVYSQVMTDLAGFNPASASGPGTLYGATSHPSHLYQDLIGPAFGPQAEVLATPEPGTLVAAMTGLIALAATSLVRRLRARAGH